MKEIDLHHMNSDDALKIFIIKYNNFFKSGYRDEIRIIHGYGSGTLLSTDIIRTKLRIFLKKNSSKLNFRLDLNPGVTYVKPLQIIEIKIIKKK
ncbi:MAG: Smr/MutS family protein [Fusobacteriaceae bacterium]